MPSRTIYFVAFAATLAMAGAGWAEDIQAGEQVVVIDWDADFRLPEGVVGKAEMGNIYTIGKTKGKWLWVTSAGGWIHRDRVVKFDEADSLFTERLKAEPTAQRYFERAMARFRMGELKLAMLDFSEAIAKGKEPKFLTGRGAVWLALGQADKAIRDHTSAIQLNPKFGPAYYNRGIAQQSLGEFDKAIADYNIALKLNDKNGRAYVNRGLCWQKKRNFENALKDFSRASDMNPMWPLPLNNRADAYNANQEYDKALADARKALELDPRFTWAMVNRGNAWRGKGRIEKALADYDQALAIDDSFPPAYHNRALALAEQGDYVQAIKDFQKALELDKDYASAYNGWAWILATCPLDELRDAKQAVALSERACRLDGSEWNHFGTLAAAYAQLEDWERATKAQRRALAMLPSTASPQDRETVAARLKLFEAKQPYVEE